MPFKEKKKDKQIGWRWREREKSCCIAIDAYFTQQH
jgi:hypothetical protein